MNFSHYIVVFMLSLLAWECGFRLGIMGYDNLSQRKTNQTELVAQSHVCPLFRSAGIGRCVLMHTIHPGKKVAPRRFHMWFLVIFFTCMHVCMCIKIHKFDITQFS